MNDPARARAAGGAIPKFPGVATVTRPWRPICDQMGYNFTSSTLAPASSGFSPLADHPSGRSRPTFTV